MRKAVSVLGSAVALCWLSVSGCDGLNCMGTAGQEYIVVPTQPAESFSVATGSSVVLNLNRYWSNAMGENPGGCGAPRSGGPYLTWAGASDPSVEVRTYGNDVLIVRGNRLSNPVTVEASAFDETSTTGGHSSYPRRLSAPVTFSVSVGDETTRPSDTTFAASNWDWIERLSAEPSGFAVGDTIVLRAQLENRMTGEPLSPSAFTQIEWVIREPVRMLGVSRSENRIAIKTADSLQVVVPQSGTLSVFAQYGGHGLAARFEAQRD